MKTFKDVKREAYKNCIENFERVAHMSREEVSNYFYSDESDWMLDIDSYIMTEMPDFDWDRAEPEDLEDIELRIILAFDKMVHQVIRGNSFGKKHFDRFYKILKDESKLYIETLKRDKVVVELDTLDKFLLQKAIVREIEYIKSVDAIIGDADISPINQKDIRRLVRILKEELGGEF